eukprot:805218-Ditylum_brightwellii.AAC.1
MEVVYLHVKRGFVYLRYHVRATVVWLNTFLKSLHASTMSAHKFTFWYLASRKFAISVASTVVASTAAMCLARVMSGSFMSA